MRRRSGFAPRLALAAFLGAGAGCTRVDTHVEGQRLEVGHHRLALITPQGWEHLDHGRQQLFRSGELQVSLVDMGVATRDGLVRELQEAEVLWHAGRHEDAIARVHELRGPMFEGARRGQIAAFWKPWTDVTYHLDPAHNVATGAAFAALIEGTAIFDPVTPERLLGYVLASRIDTRRYEIATQNVRTIHGTDWVEVETWDRVSHLSRSRLAYTESGGYLLLLAIDRGPFEPVDAAFEALLTSIQVTTMESESP